MNDVFVLKQAEYSWCDFFPNEDKWEYELIARRKGLCTKWGARRRADVRSAIETARRRAIGAVRLTLSGKPLPAAMERGGEVLQAASIRA